MSETRRISLYGKDKMVSPFPMNDQSTTRAPTKFWRGFFLVASTTSNYTGSVTLSSQCQQKNHYINNLPVSIHFPFVPLTFFFLVFFFFSSFSRETLTKFSREPNILHLLGFWRKMQHQRLKQQQQQQQQALMQQALLQQQSLYHPGLLAAPQVQFLIRMLFLIAYLNPWCHDFDCVFTISSFDLFELFRVSLCDFNVLICFDF